MIRAIGSYVHSDATTPNKGAALTAVTGSAEFASTAAKLAYGAGAASWGDVVAVFPDAEADRAAIGAAVTAVSVLRLGSGQAGRVEVALGDGASAMVMVVSTTDFAAKTSGFKAFSSKVAETVLRSGTTSWAAVTAFAPELEQEFETLVRDLREQVEVRDIAILKL